MTRKRLRDTKNLRWMSVRPASEKPAYRNQAILYTSETVYSISEPHHEQLSMRYARGNGTSLRPELLAMDWLQLRKAVYTGKLSSA